MSKNKYKNVSLSSSKVSFAKPTSTNSRLYNQSKYLGFGDVLAQVGMGAATGGLSGAAAGGVGAIPGALIGGGIGLVKGLMGESAARKQKKLEDELQSKADERQNAIYTMYENMNRQTNPQEYRGYDIKSYFNKNGGRLYAFGGSNVSLPKQNEIPLDENASIATNNAGTTEGTHETGQNIPVSNEAGQTGKYVEPGEVILQTKDGNYALSKRLGFADKYMDLLSKKAILETNMSATNDLSRNANKRDIDGLEKKINNLPKEQEALKAKLGITNEAGKAAWGDKLLEQLTPDLFKKFNANLDIPFSTQSNANIDIPYTGFDRGTSFGNSARTNGFNLGNFDLNNRSAATNPTTASSNPGLDDIFNQGKGDIVPNNTNYTLPNSNKWDNFKGGLANTFRSNPSTNTISTLDKITPFIDNVANYFLTKATPKIEKPHLNIAPVLETRVDDSAQKNAVSDTTRAYNKYVDSNVSDVTQRLANRRAMMNEGVDKLNIINETTSNAERTAKNTNRLYSYSNAVANNALLDKYDTAVTARKAGMLQDYSKNIGNVEENIQELQNRHDLTDYQTKQIGLLMKQYESSGVTTKEFESGSFDQYLKDPIVSKTLYDHYNKIGQLDRATSIKTRADFLKLDTSGWDAQATTK